MKAFFAVVIVLIIAAVAFFAFTPAKKAEKAGTVFHYYPKANIYYDVDNNKYLLLTDKGWQQSDNLPDEQKTILGEKVILDHPGQPVYADNAHHRMVYAATLYTSSQELKQKFYEDSVSSLPKPVVVVKKEEPMNMDTVQQQKSKKGLGRFFGKLFSGNKKKAKQEKEETEKKAEEKN